ncbi:CDP-glucose 4,6-dehydratase [Pectobacterium atrosepticum]|uniref:CDP-glucose 4,6-dehydratase n=1 Tax=Pectobacterium atrosepticum TaxID=29471 RepID=UPI00049A1275|nr:CDP-glucose 4,6-dehydratase [Pectobacterium atrosepticum]AIA70376.1 CDP-glucose 4,6-dehydratase [Pectobacterium atrosepticum]AIK13296.1 CDP-glucose 4,6-dehydratase [Pectobacterium atrosepticum]KFX17123.1 CDP-glucose 4,6-dehydratase [Pectobacterium atrosepticum]POW30893.1 CDP-glucose 4,6-dehydratase [Pectobacterium atrosepticum]QXE17332.1 CDP-glucose 4,6-dehydratase [Pectobacterium atrosepticum]
MVNSAFWQGKKVFVTGHTGFKGSWLCLWLQSMGAEVKGYALQPPTEPSIYQAACVDEGMSSEIGDIRDYQKMEESIRAFGPEIVFHMAAQPLVRLSYDIPVDTYATNVMGTVHLLEAVRKIGGVKAVVNITSDKCYENKEWVWGYRENEPMGGYDPYSNSKGCAELVAAAYRQSYFNADKYHEHGCALASVRAGNVIGGGDWALDRLIPDILKAFEEQRPVLIRNPHAIRPWQHVLEPLSGYLCAAQALYLNGTEYAEAWNFGPLDEDAQPVQWIVEKMVGAWGDDASWILDDGEHPHEAHYLKLDCSKAKMRLNWAPVWRLDETLNRIVTWHKAWLAGADMHQITLNEIHDYMKTQNDKGHY